LNAQKTGLYLLMISVHGLVRGSEPELGRDADTGGQIKYVLELCEALARSPQVRRVDLLTRRIVDAGVAPDYAQPVEILDSGVRIVRLDAGPGEYLRKEELWDYLDNFSDNALNYLRASGDTPDIVHSHYADAGYAGGRIASVLGIPLVHTGHSLGRVKRRRLLAAGLGKAQIESRYNMSRRIAAEEDTLAAASLVVASTENEVQDQYALYDNYVPERMRVIPPGTDLELFHPPDGSEEDTDIAQSLQRFLREPARPMILALSRPDERKNIHSLVEAYGRSPRLRETCNLVIVAGNRDDISEMDSGARTVLTDLLLQIDRLNLYGRVAYPKHHEPSDVSVIYRLATASRGVFVNPALTEPFGLTLLEAAASGLPVVATEDGGPRDILGNCNNGILVDPLDVGAIEKALLELLDDPARWEAAARNGLEGVRRLYAWDSHAKRYLDALDPVTQQPASPSTMAADKRPSTYHDRAVFSDLDQNLLGDPSGLADFLQVLRANRKKALFGIATGRTLESALKLMKRLGIPQPDVLITGVGTGIHYAPQLTEDESWLRHIDHLWNAAAVRRALAEVPGLIAQPRSEQTPFKISYYIDQATAPSPAEINSLLAGAELAANVFVSFGQFLDIVPIRASKGLALRYFATQWDIPLERILAAGGSGTDEDMLRGNTLGAVVANRHEEELAHLADVQPIFFASQRFARGIIEALEHYDFFGRCAPPESSQ